MKYDAIVVGAGMAGLTASAYLAKHGVKTALFEKEKKTGGLVNSFERNGYVFDGGIRAVENLGILFPMLRQLGIDVEFTGNKVSIGAEKLMVDVEHKASIFGYRGMLNLLFPGSEDDIEKIIKEIEKITGYMDVQYGIDNPIFKDIKGDRDYLVHTLLPWLLKYILTIGKIKKLYVPVRQYLAKFTDNETLIDIMAQHFFEGTPAYFALSYFTLYLDYTYPYGGTGKLPQAMTEFVAGHGADIKTSCRIVQIDAQNKTVEDSDGNVHEYNYLIWAADMNLLYKTVDIDTLKGGYRRKAKKHIEFMRGKKGGESVFTLYAECSFEPRYFCEKHGPHTFYTPYEKGVSSIDNSGILTALGNYTESRERIEEWMGQYFKYTTYEISVPVLRDKSLAPKGKTGLVISVLMDYELTEHIIKMGWYDEFKKIAEDMIVDVLEGTIYPRLSSHIDNKFSATPHTMAELTGNTDGAITGWAFTNNKVPAVSSLPKIAQSIKTKLPDIYQAGQWTFSPAGFPISIITGKMAADKVIKKLR